MSATNAASTTTTTTGRRYLNGILTANAILLGLLALNGMGLSFTSHSLAEGEQPRANDADEGGRISAAEQRKTMIAQLATLTQKMERLESMIAKGIPVRVLELPAGFSNKNSGKDDASKGDAGKSDAKSESKAEVKARGAEGAGAKK